MDLNPSGEPAAGARRPPTPVKIVIAGCFGVGKTTTVSAISEIQPLTTEAAMTSVAAEIDRTGQVPGKTTTTVALDFGCITIDEEIKLYLFGTPGQDRFAFMWNDLVKGALGALVIVDTRRLNDCYAAVDFFEKVGLPFVIGVNVFDGMLATTSRSPTRAAKPTWQCSGRRYGTRSSPAAAARRSSSHATRS